MPRVQKTPSVLDTLRAMIAAGDFGADGRLPPERHLAAAMKVSRRTLRTAMAVLEGEGRLWRYQGRGTFCKEPDGGATPLDRARKSTNPWEIMEARLRIEPMLAGLCALRASEDDIAALDHCCRRTATAQTPEDYEAWDTTFHRKVAQASGNSLLIAVFDTISAFRADISWGKLRDLDRSEDNQQLYSRQHHQILDAIASRDVKEAERAMHAHLQSIESKMMAVRR